MAYKFLMLHQLRAFIEYWRIKIPSVPILEYWQQYIDCDWNGDNLAEQLPKLLENLEPFQSQFNQFIKLQNTKSEMLLLINEFLFEDCSALFQLLNAIQTGNYSERNLAMKRMMPVFYAFDATNYKRWSVLGKKSNPKT